MSEKLGEVSIEDTASPQDLAAVQDLFDQAGLQVTVSANYFRKSLDPSPWIVFISMGTGLFLGQIIKRAADDSYDAARRFVVELWATRRAQAGTHGNVVLDDRKHRQRVMLDESLPTDAYRSLDEASKVQQERPRSGVLVYDSTTGTWQDSWEVARRSQRTAPDEA
jgi:hypothetical protein